MPPDRCTDSSTITALKESAILGSYCAAQVVTHLGGRMPAHSHTHVPTILDLYPGT